MLRDVRFRDALNYAIDRSKLCAVAYDGLAAPATTIMPPDTWSNPDYHWQPPADQTYTFDVAKANQLLTAAGYTLGPSGLRLYKGKPITLRSGDHDRLPRGADRGEADRRRAAAARPQDQPLGARRPGALLARIFNFKGATFAPDFDMYLSDWAGYGDPGETLTSFTTAQIGATNEPAWSNAAFDKLNVQQAAALDPATRQHLIWQMQQIFYQQSPQIVLVYPQYLQAYNTARWTGWTPMFHGRGPAWMTTATVDSYVNLQPATASSGGGGAKGAVIVIVIAVVVVVGGAAVWLAAAASRAGGGGVSGAPGAVPGASRPADTALLNGVVYTADGTHTVAQAVAVGGDGRIVAVGSDDEVRRLCGPATRLIDLEGRLVLPGFIDSHAHASEMVGDVFGVGLKGLGSMEEYVAAVRAFAADHAELPAIRGWGWSNVVAPDRGPAAAALDAAVADRPVLLTSEDGHSVWANSLALELAGVTATRPTRPTA